MTRQDIIDELLHSERTLIMGVLNITEDSFSDGGHYLDPQSAFAHAADMIRDGADIIDIGAESTRPGAIRFPEDVEKERVVSAVQALAQEFPDTALSVDTTRASVAQAALEAGAHIINDVSGGLLDDQMKHVIAQYNDCLYIVQHWRTWLGSDSERDTTQYDHGVVNDTYEELEAQVRAIRVAGVSPERIIIDPGLGFSKPTIEHNMPLIVETEYFARMGYPVLIGASRKRFVAAMVHNAGQDDTEGNRDSMTAAVSVLAAERGAWAVRVHNVPLTSIALEAVQQSKRVQSLLLDRLESEI